jgi:hypothetical protein
MKNKWDLNVKFRVECERSGEVSRDCECHNNHFIKLKSNYLNDNLYLKRENGSAAAQAGEKAISPLHYRDKMNCSLVQLHVCVLCVSQRYEISSHILIILHVAPHHLSYTLICTILEQAPEISIIVIIIGR